MPTRPFDESLIGGVVEAGLCAACGAPLPDGGLCLFCDHAPPDPPVGVTLAGKYVIEDTIGHGGMGSVYRARHIELGEPVAVKFLLGNWSHMTSIRTRFRREAIALARLRHPGVVSVLDFGEHEGEPYLVMELVKGLTLDTLIRAPERLLPLARVGAVFDQLLQVLEATHAAKIVHRDIKPENVMLTDVGDRTDRVKLLDFGLVRFDDGSESVKLTESGQSLGTPCYMSPEQCRGVGVGAPTDVYAVGVMLYEALCGVPPFQQNDSAMVMAAHMFVEPPPMVRPERDGALTPGLEAVVLKALAKRAEDRPTSAAMRDEFQAALAGTDPASLAARAATERTRVAMLSRSERALTGVAVRGPSSSMRPSLVTDTPDRVVLWLPRDDRAQSLKMALAVNGMKAILAADLDGIGSAVPAEGRTLLVVVSAADEGEARTALVRGHGTLSRTPILVLDVDGSVQTTRFIRSGASDVTLAGATDDEIVRKARRLVARGR